MSGYKIDFTEEGYCLTNKITGEKIYVYKGELNKVMYELMGVWWKVFVKKLFHIVNKNNSTLITQCVALRRCEFRFTTLCEHCKKNIGMKEEKSYFEPR